MRIAIFASGGGSNAEAIMEHFKDHPQFKVGLLVTNNSQAGALARAERFGVPSHILEKGQYKDGPYLVELMREHQIDFIALAGYLKLVPLELVRAYDRRILNIHPALLPSYGGKGMYGMNVHKAVISSGDFWSGMTIHYVNEVYDEGEVLFQGKVKVRPEWSPEELQVAVLRLEHLHYPRIIDQELSNMA